MRDGVQIAAQQAGRGELPASKPVIAEELPRLVRAVAAAQSEVRADDLQGHVWEAHGRPNSATRLGALGTAPREVLASLQRHRVAAQKRVPVVANAPRERPPKQHAHAERRCDLAGVMARGRRGAGERAAVVRLRRVELLEGEHVRVRMSDDLGDARRRIDAVGADAAMDVVAHDPNAHGFSQARVSNGRTSAIASASGAFCALLADMRRDASRRFDPQ